MITDAELAEIEAADAATTDAMLEGDKSVPWKRALRQRRTLLREVQAMREPCVWVNLGKTAVTENIYEQSWTVGCTGRRSYRLGVDDKFCPRCAHPIKVSP